MPDDRVCMSEDKMYHPEIETRVLGVSFVTGSRPVGYLN